MLRPAGGCGRCGASYCKPAMFFSLPAGPLDRVRLSRKNREIVAIAAFVEVHFMNKKLLRKWHRSSEERHQKAIRKPRFSLNYRRVKEMTQGTLPRARKPCENR